MSAMAIDGLILWMQVGLYRCVFARRDDVLFCWGLCLWMLCCLSGGAVNSELSVGTKFLLNLYFVPRQHASCYCNKMDYRSELLVPGHVCRKLYVYHSAGSLSCILQRGSTCMIDGRIIRWDLELTTALYLWTLLFEKGYRSHYINIGKCQPVYIS